MRTEGYFCFFSLLQLLSASPSTIIRINEKGLQFFADTGKEILDAEIPKIAIQDQSVEFKKWFASGNLFVKNMQITEFETPQLKTELNQPNKLNLKSNGGKIYVNADWQLDFKILFKHHMKGSLRVDAKNIETNLQAALKNTNGRPEINLDQCSVEIKNLDIQIIGGTFNKFINLFHHEISKIVQYEIRKKVCSTLQTSVITAANTKLQNAPLTFSIKDLFTVSYSLNNDLMVEKDSIAANIEAEIVYKNAKCELETKIMNYEEDVKTKMVEIFVNDRIANCFLQSAFSNDLLQRLITAQFYSGNLKDIMQTSCSHSSVCFGRLMPNLETNYPGRYLEFGLRAAEAPHLSTTSRGITVNANLELDLFVSPLKNSSEKVAELAVLLTTTLDPKISGGKLGGSVRDTEIVIKEINTSIGSFNEKIIALLQSSLGLLLELVMDISFEMGVDLPNVKGVSFSNDASIVFGDGYVRFGTNFLYN